MKTKRTVLMIIVVLVCLCCVCILGSILMKDVEDVVPLSTPTVSKPIETQTSVPAQVSTETPTPESSEAQLLRRIHDVLGTDRIINVGISSGDVRVVWTIRDNITKSMIDGGAKLDVHGVAKVVAESSLPISSLYMEGTFPMTDGYGNFEETTVVKVVFTKETLDKINWDGLVFKNIYGAADEIWINPDFE